MASPILKRILLFSPKTINPQSLSTASPPSSDQQLITTITSLLIHHRSKSRWTHLRSLILTSNKTLTPTHFSQIILLLKSNPRLALRFFHFTLRNPSFCSHDLRSISTITHILSRARLKPQAQSIIHLAFTSPVLVDDSNGQALKFFEILVKTYRECDSAPFVFDLLIKSCLELKKIDDGLKIVRLLRSRGISPLISTCNFLVSWVSKCKGCYAGYGVFREVFEVNDNEGKRVIKVRPNVHTFNELMMGFYRDGELEMVEEVWSEMERFECVPNGFSYSVLMTVFLDVGRTKEIEKLWEEMRAKGIKGDVVAYNTVIGGFCKIGEIEKAEELSREMELNGVEANCVTFEHLINGYCSVGDVDSAILVFKHMVRKGFRAEGSVMDVLIGGLCEKRRVSEALEIMRIAMRNDGFRLSGKSYELLIKGLCKDGKMDEALKLQAEMVGGGFEPNFEIYGAFIDGYMKLGNEEMAAMLRKEMSGIQKRQEEN
ncbi:pentatricopeptide repeat-containing protein At2g15980 [Ricinus communis]|uniref:Pentatricopeptide repeat-containing protein, putative n=1 Tax=Ricinus communis TaxID=3988 RepID=B9RZE4_RICCO|nr:pentatricopeptide repeat-containing protein At2g15980 [Ricinus communis]EEF43324.1 pentatricopeptide repeat-containing protein, putative [Ricinus communis]|eukprot:XP_002519113.1 pentatricopeptide repeat-containing protein At2g15980 [Ricinus communis]